jgi:hypothetical protein
MLNLLLEKNQNIKIYKIKTEAKLTSGWNAKQDD